MALPTGSSNEDKNKSTGLPVPPELKNKPEPSEEEYIDDEEEYDSGLSQNNPQPPRQRPAQRRKPQPSPPSDDIFETVGSDELLEEQDDDDFDETPPQRRAPQKRREPETQEPEEDPLERQMRKNQEDRKLEELNRRRNSRNSEPENEYSDDFDDNEPIETVKTRSKSKRRRSESDDDIEKETTDFVNKKKKKLVPFGGRKSKQKGREDELADKYDSRTNRRTKARLVQVGFLTAVVALVAVGVINVVRPPQGVSADQMNNAISSAVSQQSFPTERGSAFAENFINTFVNLSPEQVENSNMLGYYYTGIVGGEVPDQLINSTGVAQKALVPPKTFKAQIVDENSASFTVGTLIDPMVTESNNAKEDAEEISSKWVYYVINVYFDEKTDTMAVTKDSPILVPGENFSASVDIPDEKLLGTGEASEKLAADVKAPLFGYFEAFGKSSYRNHDALDQYLISGSKNKASLLRGLDDKFVLAGEAGDPGSAISYTAYETDDPNVTKLDVTVQWSDKGIKEASDDENSVIYRSRYYVEMTKNDGQWFVSAFDPKIYKPAGK